MEPVISGTITMSLRCVFTTSGFSLGGHSFFFLRSFLIRAIGFRFRPRENFLLQNNTNTKRKWVDYYSTQNF